MVSGIMSAAPWCLITRESTNWAGLRTHLRVATRIEDLLGINATEVFPRLKIVKTLRIKSIGQLLCYCFGWLVRILTRWAIYPVITLLWPTQVLLESIQCIILEIIAFKAGGNIFISIKSLKICYCCSIYNLFKQELIPRLYSCVFLPNAKCSHARLSSS